LSSRDANRQFASGYKQHANPLTQNQKASKGFLFQGTNNYKASLIYF
jgi:hypothetical protein